MKHVCIVILDFSDYFVESLSKQQIHRRVEKLVNRYMTLLTHAYNLIVMHATNEWYVSSVGVWQ